MEQFFDDLDLLADDIFGETLDDLAGDINPGYDEVALQACQMAATQAAQNSVPRTTRSDLKKGWFGAAVGTIAVTLWNGATTLLAEGPSPLAFAGADGYWLYSLGSEIGDVSNYNEQMDQCQQKYGFYHVK